MITFAILILIVAKALPGLNTQFSSIHVIRITSIVFLFAGALTLNTLNIESIGGGIGIYSGFFQVTTISQLIEIFLFMIGGGILIAWPQIKYSLFAMQPLNGPQVPKDPLLLSNLLGDKDPCASATPQFKYTFGGSASTSVISSTPPAKVGLSEERVKFTLLTDTKSTDYSLVILFSSLGSSLLISSYDLISVYLSIELQSFGLYILSTLYRDSESSTSAGLKYFLLGGLSSCIILLGTGIIYSYTGTTNLESLYIINSIIDINQEYIIQGISLGLSLIFIGFLFKIAAAPLHNWSPDVYDGTPTIVTTWLTIIPKIAILFILLELQIKLDYFGPLGDGLKTIIVNNSGYLLNLNQINESLTLNFIAQAHPLLGEGAHPALPSNGGNILKTLLLISATLSLIIGSLLGLAQIKIKRLLAYSTISHIGFILLALAVNTEQSIDSFIFYIIQYTITNLNIFLVILGLTYYLSTCFATNPPFLVALGLRAVPSLACLNKTSTCLKAGTNNGEVAPPFEAGGLPKGAYKDISFIYEFKGLFFSNPLLSISLALSLFSMAGIPPLIGFFSKQLVLYSALQNGYYFISLLAIIVSVISCSYYLQIIKVLITPSDSEGPIQFNYDSKAREEVLASPLNRLAKQALLLKKKPKEVSPAFRQGVHWREQNEILLSNTHSYLISTLTFIILLFFIKPSLILNSTQLLSLSLFYI
jgi:NADH-ubiquinone oxidoreductase chain 2